jgi:polysaccharide export outer membrane protein
MNFKMAVEERDGSMMKTYGARTNLARTNNAYPLWLFLAFACGALPPAACPGQQTKENEPLLSPAAALSKLESPDGKAYKIGAGDQVDIDVMGRTELSGSHLVGPDGRITLPVAGSFDIGDMTREEAARNITSSFQHYYTSVDVTVRVSKYAPTRIVVEGHVDQPGVLYFDTPPTLLDVLSKSRRPGLDQAGQQSSMPKRCEIIRGNDQVVWIDVRSMLENGTAGADLPLRRNDVVYVPNDRDDMVTVLGEVGHPGMVKLDSTTTLIDIVALSGGLAGGAGNAKFDIMRPSTGVTREVLYSDLKNPTKLGEISLKPGDVIFVQKSFMAKVQYVVQQVAPLGGMLLLVATVVK